MKFFLACGLLFILVVAAVDNQPKDICPTDDELNKVGCLCYSETKYLVCDGSSHYFDFKKVYSFDALVIRNSPNLPFWKEHIKSGDFTVKSLIILQSNENVTMTDNFDELLKLPSEAIKIVTLGQISPLHLNYMPQSLVSISVTGVPKLFHNNFNDFNLGGKSKLEHLQFRNVTFVPALENLVLNGMPLKVVEIVDSNLSGYVSVVPTTCPEDGRIVVDLRGNRGLKGFGFSYFFKAPTTSSFDASKCHYHVDLSDNPNLDPNILVNNLPTLKDHGDHMFIRIEGVDLECGCDLVKLYNSKPLKNNIHSVQCKGLGQYLDVVASNTTMVDNLCKKPAINAPTTPAITKKPN